MFNIYHNFTIKAPKDKVFKALSTSEGLDCWWTKTLNGTPKESEHYQFHYEPNYNWTGIVSKCMLNKAFEWSMVIDGTHKDKQDFVKDLNMSKSGHLSITVLQENGIRFKTLDKNV